MLPIPDSALQQHLIVLGKTGAGKSSALRVIVERLLDLDLPVCIIDPKGDWWGIKSSADGKRAGYPVVIFGGEHADVPLNPHAGAAVAELLATGNRPALIDLGGWMVGERTRFVLDFAQALFRHARGRRWLVIDEVHNFAPQGKVLDPDSGKMLHWTNRLASEGRGKGITLIAASQRPQKVHKDFLTSCETLIAMRTIHPLDRGAVRDWIDGCDDSSKGREVLSTLATMPRGEAWVWSPEIDFGPERLRFPRFRTYDSFKPQEHLGGKLQGWAEVDLDEVRSRLADVVAQAEANDPSMLRKRIADLEAQLAVPSNPVAIESARQEGFKCALEAAGKAVMRILTDIHEHVQKAIDNARASIAAIEPDTTQPAPRPITPRPAPQSTVAPASLRPTPGDGSPGHTPLRRAERLILTALAQYPQGRTKVQVALLAGYAHTGGSFNGALSALRSRGWIDSRGDGLTITAAGLEALGPYDPLPRGQELLRYWLEQLGKAERAALSALAEVYPGTLTREELARRAGYEPTGGGFNAALSRLRTLELIRGRNELKASDDLF